MMVRFSEIINIKDDIEKDAGTSVTNEREDQLWLSGSQIIRKAGEDVVTEIPHTSIRDHVSLEAVKYFEKLIDGAQELRGRVLNDQGISPSPILADLHYVIDNALVDEINEFAMSSPDTYDWMLLHTVRVTIASIKIGKGMGYDTKGLLELGLAAFMENVGMYKIPDFIQNKKEKLKPEEISIIKQHPKIGFQILSKLGGRYGWLS
ncbi:MAG: hypothetical protein AMK69_13135, partial [Nitrospira bacterium SG8_3]